MFFRLKLEIGKEVGEAQPATRFFVQNRFMHNPLPSPQLVGFVKISIHSGGVNLRNYPS
jgi:hypothetical protein